MLCVLQQEAFEESLKSQFSHLDIKKSFHWGFDCCRNYVLRVKYDEKVGFGVVSGLQGAEREWNLEGVLSGAVVAPSMLGSRATGTSFHCES